MTPPIPVGHATLAPDERAALARVDLARMWRDLEFLCTQAQRAAVRELVLIGYTGGNRFDHDPAVPQVPLPSLQDVRGLAGLAPDAHAARLLHTRLVRRRNMVVARLHAAADALEAVLTERH